MPTVYRAQVVLKHTSGLPKHDVTNTFWFDATGDGQVSEAEGVAERLRDFYTSDLGGAGIDSIMQYLSGAIATNGHQIKIAPIDVATGQDRRGPGFPPYHVEPFDLLGRAAVAGSLPSEVSCCLSYKNMTSLTVPPSRRRGRVYIGPLTTAASVLVAGVPRPSTTLKDTLIAFADQMHASMAAFGTEWVVYSRPFAGRAADEKRRADGTFYPALPARAGAAYPVTDAWVDDAFDTVRRRGESPATRTALAL